ncbi:YfcC family protein [Sansalvadorimonas sp. 2012CJ34-2]|uniref:YfcC family protein n=1 Tax=Parendozoicomonas callyspongiae TaxID=2942213 RepID=A0ABT0PI78_9GAMM|nr:YfcC family protein [Sansalvadorimonas sp. 2012CJ34-2]MCL6271049.1 YfcC family protein [Sansalvadorimonas sp. 2012CJ34-2]
MKQFSFPSAYTILVAIIIFVAILTWIVPAGQYQTKMDDALGRDVPIAGTYHEVEPNPQGFEDVVLAPIAGFYDPDSYEANGIDVALFVLFIGGFLAVVTKTGAIDAGIAAAMSSMAGKEKWMIPILMFLFSLGGTIYGMAEETLPFYLLLLPVMISAGYDSLTAVAVIMVGAGMGTLGSTVNPFATVIGSDAAGVSFTEGLNLRLAIYAIGLILCIAYVMRYAEKVKRDSGLSLVASQYDENREHFLASAGEEVPELNGQRKLILLLFIVAFGIMIWGVSSQGWWMARMSGLFLVMSIIVGFVGRLSEKEFTDTFVAGAADLLGVALVIGVARGIVVVMNGGLITDTILFWAEQAISGLSAVAFINVMYWIQFVLSFFVPSTSGLAVLTMPIMAPLADFSDVARDLVVTAYQSASGVVNLVTPTSGVVMGGLAIARVSYDKWIRFVWPLLIILSVLVMILLSVSA